MALERLSQNLLIPALRAGAPASRLMPHAFQRLGLRQGHSCLTVCWERRRLAGRAKLTRNSPGSYGVFAFECSGCGFWPPLAGETPALPANREIIFVRLLRNSEQKVCGIGRLTGPCRREPRNVYVIESPEVQDETIDDYSRVHCDFHLCRLQ